MYKVNKKRFEVFFNSRPDEKFENFDQTLLM